MLYLRCVQEEAGLKEEDISSHITGSAAVTSVNLSDIPEGTLGEWLCKHTVMTCYIEYNDFTHLQMLILFLS